MTYLHLPLVQYTTLFINSKRLRNNIIIDLELSLDESGFDASSLMVTPPTNSSVNSYQPRVVDLPRFQQIVDECGKDEDVGVGDGGKRGDEAISEELSSFTGSQQQAGSTVESTVDLAEGIITTNY